MLQRLASQLALGAKRVPQQLLQLSSELIAGQAQSAYVTNTQLLALRAPFSTSSSRCLGALMQQQQQQLLSHMQPLSAHQLCQPSAAVQLSQLPLPALAAAAAQPHAQQLPWQQWQQQRGLLGVKQHKNYQDHNQKKPPKYKIQTPSAVKRRVIVGEDGVMWRMQAGRRHKRYKKSRRQLLDLKGLVPLHKADAAKLRKLGYKRKWWFVQKA